MPSLNRVMLMGNVGADPEVRQTTRGAEVANISVATSQQWLDERSEETRTRTEWHRVVLWGRQAKFAREHLVKGSSIYVEGTLQTREWTDGAGNKRMTTEIRASAVQLLGRRPAMPEPSVESGSSEKRAAGIGTA